jgi:hypothetical protein
MVIPNSATTRAVIFAPQGRDATIARTLLEEAWNPFDCLRKSA